jgi:hypothetical protein
VASAIVGSEESNGLVYCMCGGSLRPIGDYYLRSRNLNVAKTLTSTPHSFNVIKGR